MSAPRPHQFIALKRLAAGSRQCRQLHMTGPATFSSLLTTERPATNLPRGLSGLRAECKRRRLDVSGSEQELMSRLKADELAHSRAFTTAVNSSKRPAAENKSSDPKTIRHFNTSRTLKAVNDSSTLDFAYLPAFDPDEAQASSIRVPLLPSSYRTIESKHVEPQDAQVMRPEISTMSADSTFSAMADVHDNSAMPIDFHAVADSVSSSPAAKEAKATASAVSENEDSTLKQLWKGIVEDVVGRRQNAV